MKTVQDVQRLITDRLEKHWADSVLAEARGDVDPRWPWTVTLTSLSGQTLNEQWGDVWRWLLDWNSWAQANGCILTSTNRRVGGATRSIPTRVAIPDITTAAAASDADWPERLDAARRRARVLYDEFPETLTSGLLRGAAQLSDVDFDLARAAAACVARQWHGTTLRCVPPV